MFAFSIIWPGECWPFRLTCHVRCCPDVVMWDEIAALSAVPICPRSVFHTCNHASTTYNRRTWHPTFYIVKCVLARHDEWGLSKSDWLLPALIHCNFNAVPASGQSVLSARIHNIIVFEFEIVPVLPEWIITCTGDWLLDVCRLSIRQVFDHEILKQCYFPFA